MKNWSLQSKIIGIIAIFVSSNLVVLGIGLTKLSEANKVTGEIVGTLNKRLEHVHSLKYRQTLMAVASRDGLLEPNLEAVPTFVKKFTTGKAEQEAEIDEFMKIASEQGKKQISDYHRQFLAWAGSTEEVLALKAQDKHDLGLSLLRQKTAPLRQIMADSLDANIKLNQERMDAAEHHVAAEYETSFWGLIIISTVALVFGVILATVILRKLGKNIHNIIESLQSNSDQVASASAQIASSSEELSQASTEQASSLEETASSLEEITAMIAKASENAGTTAQKSSESQAKAEEGRHAVEQMLGSMNEISQSNEAILTQINHSNQQMTEIVRVIQEIGNKTKVINEIVFQTKLLSFNASVEAARAGDHGKGFAVVAEEVGNLAQMSGNAAMEISEMLSGSIGKVEQIVNDTKTKVEALTQHGRQKVDSGVAVARQCAVILKDIVQDISRVAALAREISQASAEQAQGVGEINKAMIQLDSVTQQNASTSEEAASAAEQLSAQAEGLKDVVLDLARTIKGGDPTQQRALPQPAAIARRDTRRTATVVHINTGQKSSPVPTAHAPLKAAVGDSRIPSRDDDGFRDV